MPEIEQFQYAFDVADKITDPSLRMAKSLESLDAVSKRLDKGLNMLKTTVLSAIGFYGLKETFESINKEAETFDKRLTDLANISGSNKLAEATVEWINKMTTDLPVAKEDLDELAKTYWSLGTDIRSLDITSLTATALGKGKSIGDIEGTFRGLSRQLYITIDDFYSLNNSLGVTREQFGEMQKAMVGTTRGSVERINAMLGIMGKKYEDTIERQKNSIAGLKGKIASFWDIFKEKMVGTEDSGLIHAVRESLKDIVSIIEKYRPVIEGVAKGIGMFVGSIIGFFDDLRKIAVSGLDMIFGPMKKNGQDFFMNTVMPMLTFWEIMKARLTALLSGIVTGFLGSPVWTIFKTSVGWIIDGAKAILKLFGILGSGSDDVKGKWETWGKVIGRVTSAMLVLWTTAKLGLKGDLFVKLFKDGVSYVKAFNTNLSVTSTVMKQVDVGGMMRNIAVTTTTTTTVFSKFGTMALGSIKAIAGGLKTMFMSNPLGMILLLIAGVKELYDIFTKKSREAAEASKELRESITSTFRDQNTEVEKYFAILKNNQSTERARNEAFSTLKDMFPDIVNSYDTYNDLLDHEKEVRRDINKLIIENIRNEQRARDLAEVTEKLTTKRLELDASYDKTTKAVKDRIDKARLAKGRGKATKEDLSWAGEEGERRLALVEKMKSKEYENYKRELLGEVVQKNKEREKVLISVMSTAEKMSGDDEINKATLDIVNKSKETSESMNYLASAINDASDLNMSSGVSKDGNVMFMGTIMIDSKKAGSFAGTGPVKVRNPYGNQQ